MTSPQQKLRIAVLMGGQSDEHDVSLASGVQVLEALDRNSYDVVPVVLERDGQWRLGSAPEAPSLEAEDDGSAPLSVTGRPAPPAVVDDDQSVPVRGVQALKQGQAFDVAFLALHGRNGEDGVIQAVLGLAGIPYTGSGVLASALAMDKVKSKELYAYHGLPVAKQELVHRSILREHDAAVDERSAEIASKLGFPCVVKPVIGGSSVATRLADDETSLAAAIREALTVDDRALVEECLDGTELTCGVLGGGPAEESFALPVTEIVPPAEGFFDFEAKYTPGACEEITPARISPELTARVQALAVKAHEVLGCEGMSRTDFIMRGEEPVLLETNTIPGMTATSLLPQAAAKAGLEFPRLLDRLIQSALLRSGRSEE